MNTFEIDKNYILDKYKKHLSSEEMDDEERENIYAKNKPYSKSEILEKILNLYKFILKHSMLLVRQEYIYDDEAFSKVKAKLISHINNKIRSTSDGSIYIKVNDLDAFNGDRDKYEEWFVDNKSKQQRIVRNIVEELNKVLRGEEMEDKNKPMLNNDTELTTEQIIQYIFSKIPDEYITEAIETGETGKLESAFEHMMIKFGVERKVWQSSYDLFVSKLTEHNEEEVIEESVYDEGPHEFERVEPGTFVPVEIVPPGAEEALEETKLPDKAPEGQVFKVLWADGRGVQYFTNKRAAEKFKGQADSPVGAITLVDTPSGVKPLSRCTKGLGEHIIMIDDHVVASMSEANEYFKQNNREKKDESEG